MRRCDECFKRAAVRVILKRDLALRQQSKKDVMMTNNSKMVEDCGTDEDKPKYNNKIPTGTYLSFLLTIQNNGL